MKLEQEHEASDRATRLKGLRLLGPQHQATGGPAMGDLSHSVRGRAVPGAQGRVAKGMQAGHMVV